MKEAEGLAPER